MKLTMTTLEHTSPEKVGIDSSKITQFLNEVTDKKLGLQSFTVVRHDKVCAQGFFAPYSADYPHVLYSMSKSVTSTAIGFAVADGLISVDDKVSKFFPEYPSAKLPFNRSLTIKMLLTMRSDKLITVAENKNGTDWIANFFNAPFAMPPNSKFNYISENTYMLSAIISRVTGKSMLDYLDEKMFTPLGIQKPFWEYDGHGINAGGWGLYMKSEDLAKFFLPYIHGGKWIDGTQLIPEFWVKEALTRHTDSLHDGALDIINGYGYQFWKNRGGANSFRADGLFGQRCFLFPEYDALVVLNCGESEDYKLMDVFWKYFPECFQNECEENEKAYAQLTEKIATLSTERLAPTSPNTDMQDKVENRIINCKTNDFTSVISVTVTNMLHNRPGKISSMKFNFKGDHLLFTWTEKGWTNTVEAGLDGNMRMRPITLGDLNYHAFSEAAWQPDGTLKLWIRPVETAHIRRFTFKFNDDGTVDITNEMAPTFQDLAVYYFNFMGMPIKFGAGEDAVRGIVKDLILKVIEPKIHGKFAD